MNIEGEIVIGAVDIGGSKIAVGMVDDSGRVLSKTESSTEAHLGYANGLERILGMLRETARHAHVEISGHTDSVGSDDTNIQLSQRRAEAVADYLVKAGISPEHLNAVGYGKTRPIASNDTEEGRAQNRRIEFDVK